jgi:hypothetical protein
MSTAHHQHQQTALLDDDGISSMDAALAITALKVQQTHMDEAVFEAVESGNAAALADAVAAGASVGGTTGELALQLVSVAVATAAQCVQQMLSQDVNQYTTNGRSHCYACSSQAAAQHCCVQQHRPAGL